MWTGTIAERWVRELERRATAGGIADTHRAVPQRSVRVATRADLSLTARSRRGVSIAYLLVVSCLFRRSPDIGRCCFEAQSDRAAACRSSNRSVGPLFTTEYAAMTCGPRAALVRLDHDDFATASASAPSSAFVDRDRHRSEHDDHGLHRTSPPLRDSLQSSGVWA